MESIEKYVDARVLAEHLSVAKSFVYKLVSESRIPYYKIGSKYLFKISEVESHVAKENHYA